MTSSEAPGGLPPSASAVPAALPCLDRLEIVDPELSRKVAGILSAKAAVVSGEMIEMLETETLRALVRDIDLGYLVAEGIADLLGEVSPARLARYREMVREAGEKGVNLGRMLARYWVPVLKIGDDELVERFSRVAGVMRRKGEYTLKKPFDYLSLLLADGFHATAAAFLGLLHDLFSRDLPYKECLFLARAVPETIGVLPESKRNWQISQFRRVVRVDAGLAHPFMIALGEKLHLLSEDGLRRFVTAGLDAFARRPELGTGFLSLASKQGRDAYQALLVTVTLPEIRGQLNRYLQARTGMGISVRPLSSMPGSVADGTGEAPLVVSDGRWIYLADEISLFPRREENRDLYKCLVRLESTYTEFGTFNFDLERTLEAMGLPPMDPEAAEGSDLERFFRIFSDPGLARDLFTIFEQGRIRRILTRVYPGLGRSAFPFLIAAAGRAARGENEPDLLAWLYRRVALGEELTVGSGADSGVLDAVEARFRERITAGSSVNDVGMLVHEVYPLLGGPGHGLLRPLSPPFGRSLRPDLRFSAHLDIERLAGRIQALLRAKGVKVYRQDLRGRLLQQEGRLSRQDLQEIALTPDAGEPADTGSPFAMAELAAEVLAEALGETAAGEPEPEAAPYPVFWYREWDHQLGDYLHDHVRVSERPLGGTSVDFYERVLHSRYGLIRKIRRAFELLRPQALILLRRWIDGDDFDYRALIDFAVDRKAGLLPSDRLYTKRVKQQRDVAVLLLVDLSHSTSNRVFGAKATVLDLEKEAIVLFSEALTVVGDNFAMAGFSGTGRLGVDYYRIKDFDQVVDDEVRGRIGAMTPQHSTRMGGAIRHATSQLLTAAARVRLLIVLGDGFPNDTGYKREYAIADTRKAIAEARAKGIHARAITVNIVGGEALDDLYGSLHHNVISDVRELPDKLLRIYGTLTR